MMLTVLDKDLNVVDKIETYLSLVWAERYQECGDFELMCPLDRERLQSLTLERYLELEGSPATMIIEGIKIETSVEDGYKFTISGRSIESILDRRIIWDQTTINGNLQQGVKTLLTNSIISPSITSRKIDNFKFIESTDSAITSLTLNQQLTGDNLYEAIVKICKEHGIGFKLRLVDGMFQFSLFKGVDRTYSQEVVQPVIFSPGFDNLLSSNFIENNSKVRNVAKVAGEGEGSARKIYILDVLNRTGLNRRELYVDARDIRATTDNNTPIPEQIYLQMLKSRGEQKMMEAIHIRAFEGQAEPTITYRYGRDFFMGDKVEIENEFGLFDRVYISEVVHSCDGSGYGIYPTFSITK